MTNVNFGGFSIAPPRKKIKTIEDRKSLLDAEGQYRNVGSLRSPDQTLNPIEADSAASRLQRGAKISDEQRINALRKHMGMDNFDIHSKDTFFPSLGKTQFWDDPQYYQAMNSSIYHSLGQADFAKGQVSNRELGYLSASEKAAQAGIHDLIQNNYTNAAKRAGTYANTDQFNAGLTDEVGYGEKGAMLDSQNRLNAINSRRMDNNADLMKKATAYQKRKLARNFSFGETDYAKEQTPKAPAPTGLGTYPTGVQTGTAPTALSTAANQSENTSTSTKAATDSASTSSASADETTPSTSVVSGTPNLSNKRRQSMLQQKRGVTI